MKTKLNLDTYILREQRKKAFDTVLELEFDNMEELLEDSSYINETVEYYSGMDETGKYAPFCSMITYCLREYIL